MADDGKKSVDVKVWMEAPLELELRRLAEANDRKLSEYIWVVLRRHVYGHGAAVAAEREGLNSPD